jgi:hypothetical protein
MHERCFKLVANARDFVRQAVEEKMHKDFRKIILKVKSEQKKSLLPF